MMMKIHCDICDKEITESSYLMVGKKKFKLTKNKVMFELFNENIINTFKKIIKEDVCEKPRTDLCKECATVLNETIDNLKEYRE